MGIEKTYYGYPQMLEDLGILLKKMDGYRPEAMIAIARGGLTVSHFLAHAWKLNSLYTLNSVHYAGTEKLEDVQIFNVPDIQGAKEVLVVDEIVDSGESLEAIMALLKSHYPDTIFKTLALFQKKTACFQADFWAREADSWIDFFWEVDLKA